MLVALGDLASQKSNGTENKMKSVVQILNYAATRPDAQIRYNKSDIILYLHSDASYLSAPKARSRSGGRFWFSNKTNKYAETKHNGPVHVVLKILKNVMWSAAEAEIGSTYTNAQEGLPIRVTATELGHKQPPTPMQVYNTTAVGFINNIMKQKRSKAIDMMFYWLQDRQEQGQYKIYWSPGKKYLADYHTKHFSPSYHKKLRPQHIECE